MLSLGLDARDLLVVGRGAPAGGLRRSLQRHEGDDAREAGLDLDVRRDHLARRVRVHFQGPGLGLGAAVVLGHQRIGRVFGRQFWCCREASNSPRPLMPTAARAGGLPAERDLGVGRHLDSSSHGDRRRRPDRWRR